MMCLFHDLEKTSVDRRYDLSKIHIYTLVSCLAQFFESIPQVHPKTYANKRILCQQTNNSRNDKQPITPSGRWSIFFFK